MRLNTNVIMLPEPVVVYDRDCEEFFLKIGSFVSTNADISDGQLREAEGNMNRVVNKNVRFSEYPINSSGEILKDGEPYKRFLVVGPRGSEIDVNHIAVKEATYSCLAGNVFERKFRRVLNDLSSKYGIYVKLMEDGSTMDYKVDFYVDENLDDMYRLSSTGDIYGGVIYEDGVPSVEEVVADIVSHLNKVTPCICSGKLFVNFQFYNSTELPGFNNVVQAVKDSSDKKANWELI